MQEEKLTGYPSIDQPWLKYYSEKTLQPLPKATVYENIWERNKNNGSDFALEYFGNKITYDTLFQNVERAKQAFHKLNVRKGDRVALLNSSTPETVYSILALCRIGAIANMICPMFTDSQIIDRINEADASVLIVLDQFYDKAETIIQHTCVQTVVVVPVFNAMPPITKAVTKIRMRKKIANTTSFMQWNDFIAGGENQTG